MPFNLDVVAQKEYDVAGKGKQMKTGEKFRVLAVALPLMASTAGHAQYIADFQTNIISAVTSNWSGNYYVGNTNFADVLLIQNSGVLSNGAGFLGHQVSSSNNSVLVTDTGSVWYSGTVMVGERGAGNWLTILNGGRVSGTSGIVGDYASSSNNVVLVNGSGSVWTNFSDLRMGHNGGSNQLIITNGGAVVNEYIGYLGYSSVSSSNNVATVTGSGSVWSNGYSLFIGNYSSDNKLTIADGGTVYVRLYSSMAGSRNMATVTGSGSIWTNGIALYVGENGAGNAGNSLVISNGGYVVNGVGYIGRVLSSSNSVRVADGAVWRNDALYVGEQGAGNSLVVAGGAVFATNLVVGFASADCNNLVQLDSGSVIVTNATGSAVLEVRNGQLIVNGGVLQADVLVITNPCARIIHSGGTLSITTTNLDPNLSAVGDGIPNGWKQQYGLDPFDPNLANQDTDGDGMSNLQEYLAGTDPTNSASAFRVTSVVTTGSDVRVTWMTGTGKTNAVQRAGDLAGSFANIFTVTNTTGTATNYLDAGAATNAASRFYRVRLVP